MWYESTVEISKIIGMTRHEIARVEWMRGGRGEKQRVGEAGNEEEEEEEKHFVARNNSSFGVA